MKNIVYLFCIALILSACQKDADIIQPVESVLNKSELNEHILQQMGDEKLFYWQEQTDNVILSAALLSDSIMAIGYTADGNTDLSESIHLIDTRSSAWQAERERILEMVLRSEQETRGSSLRLEDIMPEHMVDEWPTLFIQVTNANTLNKLRADENVRYVEPTGYWLEEEENGRSTSGCSGAPSSYVNPSDYETISPNSKVPWNFYSHNIDEAWSQSQGDGQKICIIDSGTSDSQDNLGSSFATGNSTSRNISKLSTHWSGSWWWASLDSPHDQCGHGTSMAGLAAAPQSTDGNASGVAYKADLITVRAVQDVIITSSNEKRGVRNALKIAGSDQACKIASMSLGTPFYSSTVADGVYYANNKGVMVFAAAGTSISFLSWYGVIFPATMSQTVAVTGVKDSQNLNACEACHDGSAVDFVIVMERASDDERHSLSLATYSSNPSYIGGSSCATATMAGISALVWSKYPNENKNSILNRLKQASEFYPSQHGDYGYGRIDALDALN